MCWYRRLCIYVYTKKYIVRYISRESIKVLMKNRRRNGMEVDGIKKWKKWIFQVQLPGLLLNLWEQEKREREKERERICIAVLVKLGSFQPESYFMRLHELRNWESIITNFAFLHFQIFLLFSFFFFFYFYFGLCILTNIFFFITVTNQFCFIKLDW